MNCSERGGAPRILSLLALLLTAWPAALPVHGQSAGMTGSIHGFVRDPAGSAVPGAVITVWRPDTNYSRKTETDEEGRYTLAALPVGVYNLKVERAGFREARVEGLAVSIGAALERNVTLSLSGPSTSVEVNEREDAVEAAATTASVALGGERIEETPARSRNYLNFVTLAPGLASTPQAGAQRSMTVLRQPAADSGFSFYGLRGRNNSMEVDGLDNRDEATGGNRAAIGLEMVQEFRVASAITGAELGGAAGGLVNVVTRTGSNTMHGDVTFFAQNAIFNARRPENGPGPRPHFYRWQPGASWYGPLRRDRTFLAAAVEAERERSQEWSDVEEPFVDRINAVLQRLPALPLRSVRRGLYDTAERGETAFAKLNHQISGRDALSLRYAFSRGRAFGDMQPANHFLDESAGGSSATVDHSLAGHWFRVATPALVLETRGQFAEREQELWPNARGPMLEIPGMATFGQFWRLDGWRRERHWQMVEGLEWVRGRHRLSFGGMIRHVEFRSLWRERFNGLFIFPSIEEFEAGRPDVYSQAFGDPFVRLNTTQAGAWLQERWQIREGLLLEAGGRADWQGFSSTAVPSPPVQWSPRAGLSWRPVRGRALVLRAGFGLFVDRFPLLWIQQAVQKDGRQAYEIYAAGRDAEQAFSALLSGQRDRLLPAAPSLSYAASRSLLPAMARKWTAGLEYGLAADLRLTVQAAWVRAWRLPRTRNAALGLPPQYLLEADAQSRFRGVSVSLNRSFRQDFALLVNYDLGRTLDNGSDYDEFLMNPADARLDWSKSRLYQKHRLSASAMIELPSPPGRGLAGALLGDWNLAPSLVAGSGRPVNFLLATDALRTGAYPVSARPAGMPRNPFFMQGAVQLDARLMKTVYVLERRAKLQFGAEGFNLLNHTNPAAVSEYGAGRNGRLASYGKMTESLAARQVQLFMQFEY